MSNVDNITYVFCLVSAHMNIVSFFQEYLIARFPLYRCTIKTGKIVGFGKSKAFYRTLLPNLNYTILHYWNENQKYTAKVSRGIDDQIGKEITIAVMEEEKLAVRYYKCKWYIGSWENLSRRQREKEAASSFKFCIFLYVLMQVLMLTVLIFEFETACKMYIVYISVVMLNHLFLIKWIKFRNFLWEKGGTSELILGEEDID